MDLTKIGTSSERARVARWGSVEGHCTHSRPLMCVCVGFACVFGRHESQVVTVMTIPDHSDQPDPYHTRTCINTLVTSCCSSV